MRKGWLTMVYDSHDWLDADSPCGCPSAPHDPHAPIHGTKFAVGIIVLGVALVLGGLVAWWCK